jgi:hypothetical protein
MSVIDSIQISGVTYTIQGSGGGGKAIEGGRGISVTTGETADTVSFNLPISAGTGTDSIIGGYSNNKASNSYSVALGSLNTASGESSMAVNDYNVAGGKWSFAGGEGTKALANASFSFGHSTTANGLSSFAIGYGNKTENEREFNCGSYGVSRKASNTFGDSGNTLFVVGNAYYANPRHNAFEIRQNGDIYITSGGTDIKLQDNLGGGGGNPTVELTQAQYDALVTAGTVSADTYYIITDAQAGDLTNYYTKTEVDNAITAATSTKQDTLVSGTNIKTINNTSILGSGNIDIQGGGGSSYTAGTGIDITNDVISVTGMVATSAVTSAVTSGSTDVLTSGGAYDQLGGLKLVKLTQSAYDALSPNYDSNTLYVIVN